MKALQDTLGYTFKDATLLEVALTHPSFIAEKSCAVSVSDNQRLEFLGDAVLQLAVSAWLFMRYTEEQEGELTKMRSALINAQTLAILARRLDLGAFLRLGKGEKGTGGHERESNLADAFESLIGAMYLDGGMHVVEPFIARFFSEAIPDPHALLDVENPKGKLQEFVQARYERPPAYRTITVSGPEHQPEFEVCVSVGGRPIAQARASNRKLAEKEAARLALAVLLESPAPATAPTVGAGPDEMVNPAPASPEAPVVPL